MLGCINLKFIENNSYSTFCTIAQILCPIHGTSSIVGTFNPTPHKLWLLNWFGNCFIGLVIANQKYCQVLDSTWNTKLLVVKVKIFPFEHQIGLPYCVQHSTHNFVYIFEDIVQCHLSTNHFGGHFWILWFSWIFSAFSHSFRTLVLCLTLIWDPHQETPI